jgi:hypothetical protein
VKKHYCLIFYREELFDKPLQYDKEVRLLLHRFVDDDELLYLWPYIFDEKPEPTTSEAQTTTQPPSTKAAIEEFA